MHLKRGMPTNLIIGTKKEEKRSTMPKNNSKIQILHLVHSRRHLKRGMPELGRKLSKRAVKIAYHFNMRPKNGIKIEVKIPIVHLFHSRRHLKRGMPELGRKLSKRAVKIAYHLNMRPKNGIKIEVNYLVKIDPEIRRCNKHRLRKSLWRKV